MTANPIRVLFRSYIVDGVFNEESIEVNVLTKDAKIITLFRENEGRVKGFNTELSPEAMDFVLQELPKLKADYDKELERQNYWIVDWNGDVPSFVNSPHGRKTKQEAFDVELKGFNGTIKDIARNLNSWMFRLATTKASIKRLEGLEI